MIYNLDWWVTPDGRISTGGAIPHGALADTPLMIQTLMEHNRRVGLAEEAAEALHQYNALRERKAKALTDLDELLEGLL